MRVTAHLRRTSGFAAVAYNAVINLFTAMTSGPGRAKIPAGEEKESNMPFFDSEKAAHVAAYFVMRAGGPIDTLKLAKLAYLAERAYLEAYEMPLTGDRAVAMPKGPALSRSVDHVEGKVRDHEEWDGFVNDRARFTIALKNEGLTIDNLDRLSDANLEVLDKVWMQYGGYGAFELCEITHRECPEWSDPWGSSKTIPTEDILRAVGKTQVKEILEGIAIADGFDRTARNAAHVYGAHRS